MEHKNYIVYLQKKKMTCKNLLDRYWSCFGHLDLKPKELISVEDMVESMEFTREEAEQVTKCLEGCLDICLPPSSTIH